jgi:hypothetical protein
VPARSRLLALFVALASLAAVTPALAAGSAEARRHRATGPYVLGAAVIALVAIALMVQLAVRMHRAKRRP